MKKGHPKARSISSSIVAAITAGKANTIISALTSMAHANTGMRMSVMPGARVKSTPMMSSMAPAMAEISMKPMPSSHQSAPRPGENSLPVSGGYMNQPPSGASPKKIVQKKTMPPMA
ncbi:hypothetical protein D9M72_317070 [compost metagenome]